MNYLDRRRGAPSGGDSGWQYWGRGAAIVAASVWLGSACAARSAQPAAAPASQGVNTAETDAAAASPPAASAEAAEPGASEPALVAASKDDPAPRISPTDTSGEQAGFESSMDFEAGEKKGLEQGPAQKQALMRRFDAAEAGQSSAVPRSCPAAPAATEDADAANAVCHPSRNFVERLCAGTYPGVALVMFSAGSPWDRAYLRGESKAWTTAPGAQDQDRLARHEEVLVLQGEQQSKGGVQVISSSGASFYALRWNGSCVKLTEEEITRQAPWNKGVAPPLDWSYLDDNLQEALKANDAIKQASIARKKECRGARMGSKPPACAKLDKKLNDLIVAHLRGGAALPDPTLLP